MRMQKTMTNQKFRCLVLQDTFHLLNLAISEKIWPHYEPTYWDDISEVMVFATKQAASWEEVDAAAALLSKVLHTIGFC